MIHRENLFDFGFMESPVFSVFDHIRFSCSTLPPLCPFAVSSPSLPDKYRHNREMLMLLPPHRERPSSAMYTNITENGQVRSDGRQGKLETVGSLRGKKHVSVAERTFTLRPINSSRAAQKTVATTKIH